MTMQGLIDIQNVHLGTHETVDERALSYIEQIRNPYHYRYGKYVIVVEFVGKVRLEDKLVSVLSKK